MPQRGLDASVYIGSDLLAKARNFSMNRTTEMVDTSGLEDVDDTVLPGPRSTTATAEMVMVLTDDAQIALDTAAENQTPVTLRWQTLAGGGKTGSAYINDETWNASRSEAIQKNVEFTFTGGISDVEGS